MFARRASLSPYRALLSVVLAIGSIETAEAKDTSALRLVPFPKQVQLVTRSFPLSGKLTLEAPAALAQALGQSINEELQRAYLPAAEVRNVAGDAQVLRLSAIPGTPLPKPTFRQKATAEDYVLDVTADGVVGAAPAEAGLFYAVQTMRQLIRANREGQALPCLKIQDWPSMTWRGFCDDMTRGPSATLSTLEKEVDLGAGLKLNLFHYYIEEQFAYPKHPTIGPKDGVLTADELKALVPYATQRRIEILGSQQSFGHFDNILAHKTYAGLGENPGVLTPSKEESYNFLDDLYSAQVPLLPFAWFNVCCDEVEGLDKGPSKELAAKIGVGGVYLRHIQRIHNILKQNYGKRMAMWGDCLLKHPDMISQVPKDTVILTWAYDTRPNFDSQVLPFTKAGLDVLVCPSSDDWCRVVPNFRNAMINIQTFVRDGAKHNALGMLNTSWKMPPNGEEVRGLSWHGNAWGAECAWNAATTKPEDFDRRLGAVLFGEKGDHFGQAIDLLARMHALPIFKNDSACGVAPGAVTNNRFWTNDFVKKDGAANASAAIAPLMALVRPAIEQLEACKKDATMNADMLDAFLYGARRAEFMGQRMLDGSEAIKTYTEASKAAGKDEKLAKLAKVEQLVRCNRDTYDSLGKEFSRIWLAEAKPYALYMTAQRYTAMVIWHEDLAAKLASARKEVEVGNPLPTALELGLAAPPAK